MVEIGIKGEAEVVVDNTNTAAAMRSGAQNVFATPYLVALIEEAAFNSVVPYLEEGQGTVGTAVNIKHLAATPIGMKVTAKTTLTEIDRRRLVFMAEVFDEKGKVGEGTHERFIINAASFQAKAENKNG